MIRNIYDQKGDVMFKRFINSLKNSRTARYALIAIIILMVLLCIPAAAIGIPFWVVIILMLAVGFPIIIAIGGVGAAIGIAETAVENRDSYEALEGNDPALAEIEKERGKLQLTTIIYCVAALIVGLVCMFAIHPVMLMIVLALAVLGYIFILYPKIRAFDGRFADGVVKGEVERHFENAKYDAKDGFAQEEVKAVSSIGYDSCATFDLIEADRGRTHFRSCVVRLDIEMYDSDEDTTSYATRFFGELYSLQLQRSVGKTVFVNDKKFKSTLKEMTVASIDRLSDKFEVFSDDPEGARSLLTGALSDEILRFADTMKVPFSLVFHEDKLYLFASFNGETNPFKVIISRDLNTMDLRDRLSAYLDGMSEIVAGLESIAYMIV